MPQLHNQTAFAKYKGISLSYTNFLLSVKEFSLTLFMCHSVRLCYNFLFNVKSVYCDPGITDYTKTAELCMAATVLIISVHLSFYTQRKGILRFTVICFKPFLFTSVVFSSVHVSTRGIGKPFEGQLEEDFNDNRWVLTVNQDFLNGKPCLAANRCCTGQQLDWVPSLCASVQPKHGCYQADKPRECSTYQLGQLFN